MKVMLEVAKLSIDQQDWGLVLAILRKVEGEVQKIVLSKAMWDESGMFLLPKYEQKRTGGT